jgi:sugar lactone lactonase YvrE
MVVEPGEAWLWWVDSTSDRVSKARAVSAATPEVVVDLGARDGYFLRSLVVDTVGRYVYFSDSGASVIRRATLDGDDVQTLVSGLAQPMSLALDRDGAKLYWADQGSTAKIQRSNLDGSDVEDLVVDPVVQHPYGLVLDPDAQQLYFVDNDLDKLMRCDLDGSNVTDLEIPGLTAPIELALDLGAKKIYWSDLGDDGGPAPSIRRANLDGSSPEPVITTSNYGSLAVPLGLDLDVAAGKLYFVDGGSGGTGVIVRANLDGSSVAPLIVGLPSARGLKVILP